MNPSRLLDWLGEGNPQFFREVKGRLKSRNIGLVLAFSIAAQILLFLALRAQLPHNNQDGIYNRYCLGSPPPDWEGYKNPNTTIPDNYCIHDLLGHWMLNWQLWWLDLFLTLSAVATIALLVAGTYLLVADLSREERRGTLNFLRLSPETGKNILLGKLLGVPILLYLAVGFALPLNLGAGLAAGIPLSLMLAFYTVLAVGCACFYRAALLFGLMASDWGGLQNWLAAGAVWWFSTMATMFATSGFRATHTPLDWLMAFYPGTALSYAVAATYLPVKTAAAFSGYRLADLLWYGQPLWGSAVMGIGFMLLNFGVWGYWLERALERRFRNPTATLFSKKQSYQVSACFIILSSGFVLQSPDTHKLIGNFAILQGLIIVFTCCLIIALSPQRQALQDWARYRYKIRGSRHNLIKELILGEKSPATFAIALNLGLMALYLLPAILLFPLDKYRIPILVSLLLGANVLIICAATAQQILLLSVPKRSFLAAIAVGSFVLLPPICLGFAGIDPQENPLPWLSTVLSLVALEDASGGEVFFSILGQWLAISLLNLQVARRLQRVSGSMYKLAEWQ